MTYKLKTLLKEIATLPEFSNLSKVSVNSQGIFGNYPIHAVCTWQDKEAVETLIANGADINSIGERGETPIFRVARDKNEDFMEFLIKSGADSNVKNDEGLTALDVANGCNP